MRQAATVVNAAGPWVDDVRLLEDSLAAPSVRLTKGAHLLPSCDEPWSAAVTTPLPGGLHYSHRNTQLRYAARINDIQRMHSENRFVGRIVRLFRKR